MEHTDKFYSIKNNFESIKAYENDKSVDMPRFVMMFIYDVKDVIDFYEVCNNLILNNDEIVQVKSWLNKAINMTYISETMYNKLLKLHRDYCDFMEKVQANNNTHNA